jgi:hypothetical protein
MSKVNTKKTVMVRGDPKGSIAGMAGARGLGRVASIQCPCSPTPNFVSSQFI